MKAPLERAMLLFLRPFEEEEKLPSNTSKKTLTSSWEPGGASDRWLLAGSILFPAKKLKLRS